MKAFLMFPNDDFLSLKEFPQNSSTLIQDLELNTLFNTMSSDDKFLFDMVKKAILSGMYNDVDTILYRQNILKDCIKNSAIIRDIYHLAYEAIESRKKGWYFGFTTKYPSALLSSSVELLEIFFSILKQLKHIADNHSNKFESNGFTRFFMMLKKELNDDYFAKVQEYLKELKFRKGVLISAELGEGNKGAYYMLCHRTNRKQNWIQRLFFNKSSGYSFSLHPRDEAGFKTLSEIKDDGINLVAHVMGQSAEHILSFFNTLRAELAFYIGCLNLYEQLVQMQKPTCFPQPEGSNEHKHFFKGLYDICLAFSTKQEIIGNEMNADNKGLILITGANQGGKSTFLRSIGIAQLMMQCGMFVPAECYCASICNSLFTHYKRKEDSTMESGKLDEELGRMSEIVDHLTLNSILLFNESFAATNEREGSEIARQIVSALLEKGIKIFFVTHLYEFAHSYYEQKLNNAIFLQAEREVDGKRTFKLIEAEPQQTSYGVDLYNKIFEKQNDENG